MELRECSDGVGSGVGSAPREGGGRKPTSSDTCEDEKGEEDLAAAFLLLLKLDTDARLLTGREY